MKTTKLSIGDLVMSAVHGLGMITKLRPATFFVTWFDNQETINYRRELAADFRNLYFEYRKLHKL